MVLGSTQAHKKAQTQTQKQNLLLGNLLLVFQCMCTAIYILLQKQYVYDAKNRTHLQSSTTVKNLPSGRRQRWISKPINMTAWA